MREQRRFGAIGVAAALACALLAACASNEAVATVNGEPITRAEYNEHLENKTGVSRFVLAHLVNDVLLDQYAKSAGITVTDAEVQSRIDAIKAQMSGDAWEQLLQSRSLTEADASSLILHQIIIQRALAKEATVTPEQIRAYYEKHRAQFDQQHVTFASAAPQIAEALRQQQIGPLSVDFLRNLQSGAKIVYLDPRYDNLFAAQPPLPSGGPPIPSLLTK